MKQLNSYATYLTTGSLGVGINANAGESQKEGVVSVVTGGDKMNKVSEVPVWLVDLFPDSVASGLIDVVNGSMYMGGLSIVEILSMTTVIVSLIAVIYKGLMDFKKSSSDTRESNLKQANLLLEKQILIEKQKLVDSKKEK